MLKRIEIWFEICSLKIWDMKFLRDLRFEIWREHLNHLPKWFEIWGKDSIWDLPTSEVCVCVCTEPRLHTACRVSLGGEDNTLYPMLSSYLCQVNRVNSGDTVFVSCMRVSVCVCLCVCSGPVNQTRLKRLKLQTSNSTCMFPGIVRTWPLKKFFSKMGPGQDHMTP